MWQLGIRYSGNAADQECALPRSPPVQVSCPQQLSKGLSLAIGGVRLMGMGLSVMVVSVMAGCSSLSPTSTVKRATFSYTCCAAVDVNRVLHPGEVLTVHWIVQPGAPTSATQPHEIKLSAGLTGPYANISSLKQHGGTKTPSISAPLVVTSDLAGGTPTSRLLIPANAAPGFYDLSTAAGSGGFTVGGGSIIRVAAR